jgi:hypothetical protein
LIAAVQGVNQRDAGALRIDAMAGASAGSMTALLAARTLVAVLDPVDVMYRAWVATPQLDKLCDGGESPLSVTRTRSEAERLLGAEMNLERAQPTPIRVSMALGCLHGLTYSIPRIAGRQFRATTHLDWAEFEIDQRNDPAWYAAPSGRLDSALASGAHMAAFPPHGLDRSSPSIRAGYGHWEGDLLIGTENKSAIATLVERQTRYVLLARLGHDRTTSHVVEALKARIAELPAHLLKSLTWDQGQELAAHKRFSSDTGIQVYFCDPRSPWQRGSNENTNGLLRQYLPRKLDLAARSQAELDQIAAELNARPRETLEWRTPAEKMEALLR